MTPCFFHVFQRPSPFDGGLSVEERHNAWYTKGDTPEHTHLGVFDSLADALAFVRERFPAESHVLRKSWGWAMGWPVN